MYSRQLRNKNGEQQLFDLESSYFQISQSCHSSLQNNISWLLLHIIPDCSGPLAKLYSLSYMWYSATAVLTVVVIGLIVSFVTGKIFFIIMFQGSLYLSNKIMNGYPIFSYK